MDDQGSQNSQNLSMDDTTSNTGSSSPISSSTGPTTPRENFSNPSQNPPITNFATEEQVTTAGNESASIQEAVTAPHAPRKYGGKKVVATIFGILVLIGGVASGVFLVQRQQEIRERAAKGSACDQSPDCVLVDNARNSGSKTVEREIIYVDITDKEFHRYYPGDSDDGCRKVNIAGNTVSWERYGDGPNCKDVSNVQIWMGNEQPTNTPTPPPENTPTLPPGKTPTLTPPITEPPNISAECSNVKAYNTSWNLLTQAQLNDLDSGTTIRFTVSGTANSGSFDKARFSVNSASLGETTLKKPSSEEFYIEYTIPADTDSFDVSAQIHHSELGWF
jgi:hypothetical protein